MSLAVAETAGDRREVAAVEWEVVAAEVAASSGVMVYT